MLLIIRRMNFSIRFWTVWVWRARCQSILMHKYRQPCAYQCVAGVLPCAIQTNISLSKNIFHKLYDRRTDRAILWVWLDLHVLKCSMDSTAVDCEFAIEDFRLGMAWPLVVWQPTLRARKTMKNTTALHANSATEISLIPFQISLPQRTITSRNRSQCSRVLTMPYNVSTLIAFVGFGTAPCMISSSLDKSTAQKVFHRVPLLILTSPDLPHLPWNPRTNSHSISK